MKEFRMRAFFGIVGLAAAGFMLSSVTTVGCGSDSKGGSGGSGGSGNTTGTAGTTGGGGTGGSGGGGGTATLGCQISAIAPARSAHRRLHGCRRRATLAIGGTFVYPMTGGPMRRSTNGALHITATSTGMASAQYWGAGIYFNGDTAGTALRRRDRPHGRPVRHQRHDRRHGLHRPVLDQRQRALEQRQRLKGSGDSTSYAPQAALTVSSTVTTVMMPFSGTGAPAGGNPAVDVDKSKLTGVQWQFTTAAGHDEQLHCRPHDRQREVLLDHP